MTAKEQNILNGIISGNKRQFIVPVFQRNYDWREKDCKRLFDDVVELTKNAHISKNNHFMGAFICKFNRMADTSYEEYILIDGQQRLTSITLMLKALYDSLENLGEDFSVLHDEINETYLINKFASSTNYRLRLKPNESDGDDFTKLMNNDSTLDKTSSIYRNYFSFRTWIASMNVSVNDFYSAILRLEGIFAILDDSDNPQLIFESLNSTGLELTDVDLIRNYLLMNYDSKKQSYLYKTYWFKVERLLGDFFPQFIRDYLSLKNGSVTLTKKNVVYDTFKKYYSGIAGKVNIESFLKDLLKLSRIYSKLLEKPTVKNTLNDVLSDYIELGMKTTYPFVFGLLIDNMPDENGKQNINDKTLSEILEVLESYLIRRNICNLAGGGMSQVMASLYNTLKEKYGSKFYIDTTDKVAKALVGITSKAYFPKDDQFRHELIERDMYHNRNIEFILKKFERSVQGKEVLNLDNLSVEHVMPQTLSEEWKKYLAVSDEDLDSLQKNYISRIGNLTLTAYNSEMYNKLYSEKKSHIDFSRLTVNQYFKEINKWDKEEILTRGEKLADSAIKLWSYPLVNNDGNVLKEPHQILDENDDYDYEGTKPIAVRCFEKDLSVDNWTNAYVYILKSLYDKDRSLFVSLFSKPGHINKEKPLISIDSSVYKWPQLLVDGYYVDKYIGGTNRKIDILKKILTDFQVESSDVIIFF